jgi:predicted metal-dependent peptidase
MNKDKFLNKAKIGLVQKKAIFYSTIIFNLKTVWDTSIPTAAVDGKNLFLNEEWFCNLTIDQAIGLLAHEAGHIALDHLHRSKNYNKQKYNIAGDYVINLLLDKDGYELPAGRLLDYQYNNLTTEQVYNLLSDEDLPQIEIDIIESENSNSEEIKNLISKAALASKMAKESSSIMSGLYGREIEEYLNPRLPWNVILQNYVDTFIKEDYSWSKPNKRIPDIYLPSLYSEGIDCLVFASDVSGSITQEDFNKGITELKEIRRKLNPRETILLSFDTKITQQQTFQIHEDIPFKPIKGYGGTEPLCVFEFLKTKQPTLVIVFTDGEFYPMDIKPNYSVLWILTSFYDKAITFGDIIYYD